MDEGFRTKEITVVRLQKALELCVPEQTSYGELKSVVRTSLNIPACRQRFRVAGAAVEDDDVPMEGVRVELMVDLRGGGCPTCHCAGCDWYGPCAEIPCGSCDFYCTIQ